ncbi:MAG: murein biosynthesis integral membrane protein MurJ [Nakamurella sp.]
MSEPIPNAPMRTERTGGVMRASGTMAVATLVSRLTGFVAKVVIVGVIGFSAVNDAYSIANTLPNIIFELLLGGVLTSVAIPLLTRARSDPDGGEGYTNRLMTMALVGLLVATGAAVLAAPALTRLYLSSGDNTDAVLATELAYLLLPQIFFYGMAALFGAILNTKERFAAPVWAPVVNNLVVIAVGVMLGLSTRGQATVTMLSRDQLLLLGLGTTLGIVMQAVAMIPSLRRAGYRFHWRWGGDSRMREAGSLMLWAIAYVLISQVGYIVTTRVASHNHAKDGFIALYNYGSMLFQLPYGILGVSLLTAIMPRMSRHAASGDMRAVKTDLGLANRLSTVALLPVTAAMIALAVPLTIVTARYGRVTDTNAHILAFTLAAFAFGLLPLAITLVQMRVFYAMKDGRTPTIINAIMVAVRVPLLLACLGLPERWVVPGLAGATSVSYVVGVVVGEIWLRVRFGSMGFGRTLDTIARTALASVAGGAAAWWVTMRLLPASLSDSLIGAILQLAIGGLVGLIIVVAVLMLLRGNEIEALRRRLTARVTTRLANRIPPAPSTWNDGDNAAPTDEQAQGQESVTDQHDFSGDETLSNGEPRTGQPGTGQPSGGDYQHGDGTIADPTGVHRTEPDPVGMDRVGVDEATAARAGQRVPEGVFYTPGMVVGERYRLTRRVAYDAVGNEFWLARDTVLPRDMAVTLLPTTDPTSPTVTHTLQVGRLHHPGLPQLLDMGSAGTSSYVAGQWVDGATLVDLLQEGPLEGAIVARLTAGIADAVAEVHRAGYALGTIHPALVRVGMDGRVRLSHVIARVSATANDDVQAIGALTYLMLTGTWPLDPATGPADIPAAPRRGSSEVAAAKVVSGVPAVLSRLAANALNNEGSRHVTVDEIADIAKSFENGGTSGGPEGLDSAQAGSRRRNSGARRESRPPQDSRAASTGSLLGPPTTPARLQRDRRLKLSIAGVMLTALTVLIVIMGSSVVQQILRNIVAPIKAADQQQLITVPKPTTTQTVAGPSEDTPGSSGSATPGGTTPVKIASATVYDPEGKPPADYESYVDRAYDGDLGTFWPTWVYKQQIGPGGIKSGVGLMLTFATAVAPSAVTLSTTTPGTEVEVRSADSPTAALAATTVLGTATLSNDPVTITLTGAPSSKYLIVWITKLAPYQGGTASNQGQFQSTISEIGITQ